MKININDEQQSTTYRLILLIIARREMPSFVTIPSLSLASALDFYKIKLFHISMNNDLHLVPIGSHHPQSYFCIHEFYSRPRFVQI